jgi:hypothetical protein
MAAVSLKNQILNHCGKIHSGIDEEPKFKFLGFPSTIPAPGRMGYSPGACTQAHHLAEPIRLMT